MSLGRIRDLSNFMDLKSLPRAIEIIAEEKGVEKEKVLEVVESAIAAAYKKEYEKKGEIVKAKLDLKTGDVTFIQVKTVFDDALVDVSGEDMGVSEGPIEKQTGGVDPSTGSTTSTSSGQASSLQAGSGQEEKIRYNPDRHILFSEAKKIKPDTQIGEEIIFPLETQSDFGRIAAQTAKQVILQRLREAERESVIKEFQGKEGEIVSGVIQRIERSTIHIDLGRTSGVMFFNESIPGENYRSGDRMRFYLLAVQDAGKGPSIVLSRSHPKFIEKLFALEVPEIGDGVIDMKAIAREAGSRTKIAVHSNSEKIDPVGSCVGQRGVRVMAVSNEIGQEKIDIIEWSEDPAQFIANALSPAKVVEAEILEKHEARVFVPDDQLSLAIGKGGQNVRLAAKLTGWRIDVRSQSKPEEAQTEGIAGEAPLDDEGTPAQVEVPKGEDEE